MQVPAQFIRELESRLDPVETEFARVYWQFANSGDEALQPRLVELEMQLHAILSSAQDFGQVQAWRKQGGQDAQTTRILDHLYYAFLTRQEPEQLARRRAELDTQISGYYANYRGEYQGQRLTNNDIKDFLKHSDVESVRRGAWEASKGIGPVVADLVLELVGLRNATAHSLGFRDYYAMMLAAQEIDEAELFELLARLEELTREPFRRQKQLLDAGLVERFGLADSRALRPWHYEDPFFQEAPRLNDLDLDPFVEGHDLEQATLDTFDRVGLDVRQSLSQSDLYERDGKDQHAFCLTLGRHPETTRCLCNCRGNADWAATMLHEFGHAAYDQYIDPEQPFFLRTVAHTNSTEAIAMLFGRLVYDPAWLEDILRVDPAVAAQLSDKAHEQLSFAMLVFTRWMMVMVHFERDLYGGTVEDLNKHWWDLVEKYQFLIRPEGRNQPDWASKTHIAEAPVYYHNYMLGELTASQLQHYIEHQLGQQPLIRQPRCGAWLREGLFEQGALRPWNAALEFLTGEKLNSQYFVSAFVTPQGVPA